MPLFAKLWGLYAAIAPYRQRIPPTTLKHISAPVRRFRIHEIFVVFGVVFGVSVHADFSNFNSNFFSNRINRRFVGVSVLYQKIHKHVIENSIFSTNRYLMRFCAFLSLMNNHSNAQKIMKNAVHFSNFYSNFFPCFFMV
mgnify:CR=1 FL=1